jgi:C4-type Zn-finger protein
MLVRISTVPGRNDVMTISLYCESCRYQWTIEDTDESDHSVQSKPEK